MGVVFYPIEPFFSYSRENNKKNRFRSLCVCTLLDIFSGAIYVKNKIPYVIIYIFMGNYVKTKSHRRNYDIKWAHNQYFHW